MESNMKMFKKVLISACLIMGFSAHAVDVKAIDKEQLARAKVVNMTVELKLPDGSLLTVDNIDFCTPGSFYNGVQAIVFGDDAVKIMQAGMAALHPHVGDSVLKTWNNKVNENDPRLPTFLMITSPEAITKKVKPKGEAEKVGVPFRSSAKLLGYGGQTPGIMATCGGYNHPPG